MRVQNVLFIAFDEEKDHFRFVVARKDSAGNIFQVFVRQFVFEPFEHETADQTPVVGKASWKTDVGIVLAKRPEIGPKVLFQKERQKVSQEGHMLCPERAVCLGFCLRPQAIAFHCPWVAPLVAL